MTRIDLNCDRNAWPHRCAVLLVCVTFPLIWVGGLVTTYDAGMAVPDWPQTFGYNMFLYPWSTWIAGPWDLFIEHGHRLLGALVGLVTIGFVWAVWIADSRRWVRWCAVGGLVLVTAQGVLGGARVLLNDVLLARLHGCMGPLFLAYCVGLASATSAWWQKTVPEPHPDARLLQRTAMAVAAMAYAQIVLGAHLRHVPAGGSPYTFRALVWAHLTLAVVLVGQGLWLTLRVVRHVGRRHSRLLWPSVGLSLLLLVQLAVGLATWVVKYNWPTWLPGWPELSRFTVQSASMVQAAITTAHVAIGSLILAIAVLTTIRAARLLTLPVHTLATGDAARLAGRRMEVVL